MGSLVHVNSPHYKGVMDALFMHYLLLVSYLITTLSRYKQSVVINIFLNHACVMGINIGRKIKYHRRFLIQVGSRQSMVLFYRFWSIFHPAEHLKLRIN